MLKAVALVLALLCAAAALSWLLPQWERHIAIAFAIAAIGALLFNWPEQEERIPGDW